MGAKCPLRPSQIKVVVSYMDDAASLQDRIAQASSLAQALLLSRDVALNDVLIEFQFTGAATLIAALRSRRTPYIFYAAQAAQKLSAAPTLRAFTKSLSMFPSKMFSRENTVMFPRENIAGAGALLDCLAVAGTSSSPSRTSPQAPGNIRASKRLRRTTWCQTA